MNETEKQGEMINKTQGSKGKTYIILAVVAIILIISLIIYFAMKGDTSTSRIDTDRPMDGSEIVTVEDHYNETHSFKNVLGSDGKIECKNTVTVSIPKITGKKNNIKTLNEKIYNKYKTQIDIIENNNNNGNDVDVDKTSYKYKIKDNVIYILIERDYTGCRASGFKSYVAYYYDITNDKELSNVEAASKLGITIDKVNKALKDSDIKYWDEAGNKYASTVSTLDYPVFINESGKYDVYIPDADEAGTKPLIVTIGK